MCSIEEAWGSNNTFRGEKVFSQADVHDQYMNTPENLNYPSMNYGPMTKTLPNKHRFSRGVHSKLSRKPRMDSKEYKNRGQNGNATVRVTPDYSAMKQNDRDNRPDYLDLFPKPVDMIPSVDKYPLPVRSNIPQPLNTSEEEEFTPWNEAFTVSSTVDHFMNNGLTSPEDITEEEELGVYGNEYRKYEVTDDDFHSAVDSKTHRNTVRGRVGPRNLEDTTSEENDNVVSKHLQEQKEVLLLLNKIISRIDKLERNIKKQPTYTKSDVAIYAIVASIVSIVVFILITKIIKLLQK